MPLAIREDYAEACAIKDLSPKAAATLARRAVQGIIRDFWGIKKARLIDEIKALEAMVGTNGVTQETVNNIDAVREVGNIGAHMEKDVDLIIDVEPEEADLLIQLVESLIEETYVERNRRQERSAALMQMKAEKAAQKKPAASAVAAAAAPASTSPAIPIPPSMKISVEGRTTAIRRLLPDVPLTRASMNLSRSMWAVSVGVIGSVSH